MPSDAAEPRFMRELETLKKQDADKIAADWLHEYEKLDPKDSIDFFARFEAFLKKREAALFSLDIPPGLDERVVEEIKQFDRDIMLSFGNASLFQGNGGTAETYEIVGHPTICVKFITNQAVYNQNNHIRTEFGLLNALRGLSVGRVRTPTPYFLRIHPRDGHSYGMEKVNGKTLSQINEKPGMYPDLIAIAQGLDRNEVLAEVTEFVVQMHKEKAMTHGDLFARNIMLDHDGNIFIIDFGKAKRYESDDSVRDMQQEMDLAVAQNTIRSFFAKIDKIRI